MLKLFLALLLLPGLACSESLLTNTDHRHRTSLGGTWNYIVDPYETGYYNYRHEPYDQEKEPSNAAFFTNYHARDKSELVEYDFDKSPHMAVPGDWTDGPNIVLNGKSVYLRGISIHEENAQRGARAYSEANALVALTWAKELGCNYVRLAHYPHNEHMVRMADKIGLLVWEEIPVYWTVDFASVAALKSAKQQLTEAMTRDKNRAAIRSSQCIFAQPD